MPGLELDKEMVEDVRRMPRDCKWSQDKVKVTFEFTLDPVATQDLNIDQVIKCGISIFYHSLNDQELKRLTRYTNKVFTILGNSNLKHF